MNATVIIVVLAAIIVVLCYLMISHRRRILALNINFNSLPDIETGLDEVAGLTGGCVVQGNKVEIFQNGLLLREMMKDISEASETIHFETYIWCRGRFESALVELLCRKASEGIKVRVLIDALGAIRARDRQLKRLKAGGVELCHFRHFKALNFHHFNNRMHRKILVVDGLKAYTCGHGVADEWLGNAQDSEHWRDTGTRLTGPVVHHIQSIFMQDWCSASRSVPVGAGCFPKLVRTGDTPVHVVKSSTKTSDSSVALFYKLAMASAKKEIIIQNPYFSPDADLAQLLMDKAASGVNVHLMLPGRHTDNHFVRLAGRKLYRRLLDAGVRIYEFLPTMMHQKVVVIDGKWSHVGTTNLDMRSLALNAELGVGILDRRVALQLRQAFKKDLERCQRINSDEWRRRSWPLKVGEWCAFRLRAQI